MLGLLSNMRGAAGSDGASLQRLFDGDEKACFAGRVGIEVLTGNCGILSKAESTGIGDIQMCPTNQESIKIS